MKSHLKISYYTAYVTIKDSKYLKINSVNPLYLMLMFNRKNGYFEEIYGNKHLTLVSTNESREKIKKYEELWIKIRDYDEKYMKVKFESMIKYV